MTTTRSTSPLSLRLKAALCILALAGLAACGGGGGDSSSASSSGSGSSSSGSDSSSSSGSDSSSSSDCSSQTTEGAKLTCLANAFLATLSSSQQSSVVYALTSSNATNYWSNLPTTLVTRHGIALKDLSATAKTAAEALIAAALSSQGQTTMTGERAADGYLAQYQSSGYGQDLYYISFLSSTSSSSTSTMPSASPWILEFTGHHYTFLASVDGDIIGLTPNFVGVEPRAQFTYNGTAYQPMLSRHDTLLAMLNGLSSTQLSSAKLSQAYDDVLVGPQKDGNYPSTQQGLAVSALSDSQKALVKAAIASYASDANGTGQYDAYTTDSAINGTYIAWASYSDLSTKGSYVRIDGPGVWIEFSVQSGIVLSDNHYHSIWRDKSLDYGGNFSF
ncbi:Protein of unknown function [Solimonas aquatica]|uniref:DUF3500 domain-containing protein n=1 Tax=Solimonas aquatica TaxID=489703 RepID=A0A1H9GGR3_9GAMM|nr:DUF3500 domain-containing protein [Solimonas aquatica]SEQ49257.1 Protein of unknown function [Solimonas aquatica]